jgi:hypothetical protein
MKWLRGGAPSSAVFSLSAVELASEAEVPISPPGFLLLQLLTAELQMRDEAGAGAGVGAEAEGEEGGVEEAEGGL